MTTMATELPTLPHWQTTPDDLAAATREVKAALKARIAASGRTVERSSPRSRPWSPSGSRRSRPSSPPAQRVARGRLRRHRRRHRASRDDGLIQRRGCAVVRGHFPREQAQAWDAELVDYVDRKPLLPGTTGAPGRLFSTVGSKPEIYPIYWSGPQMEARQSDEMATVQSFLNSFWRNEPTVSVRPQP